MDAIRQLFTKLGELAAHPGAFAILIVYAVLWVYFDRESLDWHATTTLIVWFMTLLIARASDYRNGSCAFRPTALLSSLGQGGEMSLSTRLDKLEAAMRGRDGGDPPD